MEKVRMTTDRFNKINSLLVQALVVLKCFVQICERQKVPPILKYYNQLGKCFYCNPA